MRPRMTRLCSNCKQAMFEPEDLPSDQRASVWPAFPHELHMENSSEVCPQWADAGADPKTKQFVEWSPEAKALLEEVRKIQASRAKYAKR